MNSPVTAPIMAAGKVIRSAARMNGNALGSMTVRSCARRDAPITRVASSRPRGTCWNPATVLMNTMKNTKYAAMRIFGAIPRPNHRMNTGPMATAGTE